MQQDLGSIEVAKIADLLVLDRNSLANIENTLSIHYVMKNGELFEGDTLDAICRNAAHCPHGSPLLHLPRRSELAQPIDSPART